MKAILKTDFTHRFDSTTMHGVATRSGKFVYPDGVRIKDWDNLKEQFAKKDYLVVIGSKEADSHKDIDDRIIGFGWNFQPNDMTEEMEFDLEYFDDIKNLSDLDDPNDLPVSIGFKDEAPPGSGTQKITDLHHIAVSLNANEQDRCSASGGTACTVSMKTDSDKGRSSSSKTLGDLVKLKKKETILMAENIEKITENSEETDEEKNKRTDAVATKKAKATPDNIGSNTTDEKLIEASAQKAFVLDCQKYGTYSEGQCMTAYNALKATPNSPTKSKDKSTESKTELSKTKGRDFDERMDRMEKVINDLAGAIPTLSEVVRDKQNANAIKMVEMRDDLSEAGYCEDMLGKMTDFNELETFYRRARTNKSNFREPLPDEVIANNNSRLLGKKKRSDMDDFAASIETAKKDAIARMTKKVYSTGGN